jgi:membrane-bound lytic murein transglycosylase D
MVDRPIGRLLEYDPMPRLRLGLIAGACIVGLTSAACAGKAKFPVAKSQPEPAPVPVSSAAAPAAAKPAPAATPAPLPSVSRVAQAVPEPVLAPPAPLRPARPVARQAEAQSQTRQPELQTKDDFPEKKAEPAPIDDLLTIPVPDTVPARPAITRAVADDFSANPPDIDIPLNPRVLTYVDLFSGRLKGYLEDGLNRGSRYLPMIQDVFRAEGVPLDLAYVPLVESAFKPDAVSRAKAKGMWQFMHGTALENGLQHDWYIDERADPEKATRAAARYLKTLYGMFGDWNLALASYNGGPGRVQHAMKRSGKDDFWVLSKNRKYLPRETRDYVPLILAAITIARNPAQYGMTMLTPQVAPPVERVTLTEAIDLRRIAEWIGVPVQTLQDLNPELRRWTTPIRGHEYDLKVPEGQGDVVRARLTEVAGSPAPLSRYAVKKNETLATIARKLGVARADLADANYLRVSAKVQPGQSLIVPRAPTYARLDTGGEDSAADAVNALALKDVDAADSGRSSKTVVHAKATSGTRKAPATTVRVVHRVKAGETLTSIAETYGTTVPALKESNHLHSNTIRTGQRLSIVVPRSTATD